MCVCVCLHVCACVHTYEVRLREVEKLHTNTERNMLYDDGGGQISCDEDPD